METFWCIFVENSTFVSPPSEHEELYIVYNCSLARTVLHEYSHIYFVLIWIACAGFLLQRKIKQIQDSVACMHLWTVVGLLRLHTFIFCLRKLQSHSVETGYDIWSILQCLPCRTVLRSPVLCLLLARGPGWSGVLLFIPCAIQGHAVLGSFLLFI